MSDDNALMISGQQYLELAAPALLELQPSPDRWASVERFSESHCLLVDLDRELANQVVGAMKRVADA